MVDVLIPCGSGSHLQRCTDGNDFVAFVSINLQQHCDSLLQHRTTDIVEAAARFVHGHIGDLTVSRRHCESEMVVSNGLDCQSQHSPVTN